LKINLDRETKAWGFCVRDDRQRCGPKCWNAGTPCLPCRSSTCRSCCLHRAL
jgi:hypothetical protein